MTKSVSVTDFLNDSRFTFFQAWVCLACFLVVLLEGFDLVIIGVAAPKIAEQLRLTPSSLGFAIGAGQIGPLVGAALLGMLADRFGRKWMLALSALLCGVFTVATSMASTAVQLAAYRFLSGIGIGGAVPNALAFGCEYSPKRLRASLATTMWAGMAFGAVIAGVVAAFVLPRYGWQRLFWVGGIPAVIVAIIVWLVLPETLVFLARQGADQSQIRRILCRISPDLGNDPTVEFYSTEKRLVGPPVKHLFTEGRALTTLMLWALSFLTFYFNWVLLAWTPTFLRRSGASTEQASLAFAFLNLGSAVAIITMGRLMDRFDSFRIMTVTCLSAFIATGIFGLVSNSTFPVIALTAVVTGFFVFGANAGYMALVTMFYPVSIRGSGVGWAYAMGKFGSIAAPIVGGFLLTLKWSVSGICIANGTTGLLMALVIILLQRHTAGARGDVQELQQ